MDGGEKENYGRRRMDSERGEDLIEEAAAMRGQQSGGTVGTPVLGLIFASV